MFKGLQNKLKVKKIERSNDRDELLSQGRNAANLKANFRLGETEHQ